jgi:hypothetical protein
VSGVVRALAILGTPVVLTLVAGGVFTARMLPRIREAIAQAGPPAPAPDPGPEEAFTPPADEDLARRQVEADLETLRRTADEHRRRMGVLPADAAALYGAWRSMGGDPEAEPLDPFDGSRYGYGVLESGGFVLWSSGPDGKSGTEDDLERRGETPSR